MPRLPDRFDLWVRKARECPDQTRQIDYVLGALAGLKDWYFFDIGPKDKPRPAEVEIENHWYILVFSDPVRIEDINEDGPPSIISIPTATAMPWCVEQKAQGCAGLLVNPGAFAVTVSLAQLETFHEEWSRRQTPQASGFWIPHVTTAEEDFWQEHGL